MKNEALYNKTVGILVDAYFTNELEHGYCTACAVGNICRHSSTLDPEGDAYWIWKFLFVTDESGIQRRNLCFGNRALIEKAHDLVSGTGYTVDQLAKIEFAFETAPKGNSDDEWMFNGLMSVIDILDQIHENTDAECTQTVKNRFVKLQTA